MIKGKITAGIFSICLLAVGTFASPSTQIIFQTTSLGLGRWQYSYDVTNVDLPSPIEEFTIWFDYSLYGNLAVETPDPPASDWDEVVWQPDALWSIDGAYDALTLNYGIDAGQTVSGFAVSFDWLGKGDPGSQFYEIINPETEIVNPENWKTPVDSGWTTRSVSVIPAPSALLMGLLGTGAVGVWRKFNKTA